MTTICFLLATFCLYCTAANHEHPAQQWTDPRYSSRLKAVVDILWETFTTEIQKKENALFFSVPALTDVAFIYDVLDEETKQGVGKLIDVFDVNELNLTTTADGEFIRALSNEMRFRTIFYRNDKAINERKLNGLIVDKLSLPNKRFNLVSVSDDDSSHLLLNLLKEVEMDSIGKTCEVRYCPVQEILSTKPPFAITTLTTWNVTSVGGFEWTAPAKFALSETSVVQVRAAQGYAYYDYAVFKYPDGCIGRVLRLPYRLNFNLIFVIPWGKDMCKSSQVLWENVQNANFNALQYKSEAMFVSIPLFKVSANINLKMKLKGTALADAIDQPSSRLYNTLAFQAAEVIFNPQVAKNLSKTVTIADVMTFEANSPFFFALFHATSPAAVVAGLINNPGCTSECDVKITQL